MILNVCLLNLLFIVTNSSSNDFYTKSISKLPLEICGNSLCINIIILGGCYLMQASEVMSQTFYRVETLAVSSILLNFIVLLDFRLLMTCDLMLIPLFPWLKDLLVGKCTEVVRFDSQRQIGFKILNPFAKGFWRNC